MILIEYKLENYPPEWRDSLADIPPLPSGVSCGIQRVKESEENFTKM